MEAYQSMKVSEASQQVELQLDEKVKTTHQDPLVTVHKNGSLHTHANLSVAAKIHGFKAAGVADKVHKAGEGKQVQIGSGMSVALSKHHAKEVKEEVEESVEEACSRSKMKNEKLSSKEKMKRGMYNEQELDPVDDKANDKKFKDRKDKDIDNDGDVDSSDEYLHKRRKATDDAIDAKKEATEADGEDPEKVQDPKKPKVASRSQSTKDIKHNDHTSDKKAEISKIESVDTREAFIAMWSQIEEAVHGKDTAAGEEIDSKESPKSKEFIAKHKKSDKKIEDGEEQGHEMATKAGQVTKQAPNRGNDNLSNGDKKPVKGN